MHLAMCCSVLQYVAMRCSECRDHSRSLLMCVAVRCSVLQCVAMRVMIIQGAC